MFSGLFLSSITSAYFDTLAVQWWNGKKCRLHLEIGVLFNLWFKVQCGLCHFVLHRGCGARAYRMIIRGCHRNRPGDSTAWPVAWVRELRPRSIEASICLLHFWLATIGNPGRRQGSAAPTSEALVRRKGWFSSMGTRGKCRHSSSSAAAGEHDQDNQQRRSEDAVGWCPSR